MGTVVTATVATVQMVVMGTVVQATVATEAAENK
jgi:hypothetical protein